MNNLKYALRDLMIIQKAKQEKLLAKCQLNMPSATDINTNPVNGEWDRVDFAVDTLTHVMEEVVELRQELPRKWWKDEPEKRQKLLTSGSDERSRALAEFADIVIHLVNFATYLNVSPKELTDAIMSKIDYNSKRPDQN
jgi:NTP pyrophosphatase (non-canonical NTP hydrolase)